MRSLSKRKLGVLVATGAIVWLLLTSTPKDNARQRLEVTLNFDPATDTKLQRRSTQSKLLINEKYRIRVDSWIKVNNASSNNNQPLDHRGLQPTWLPGVDSPSPIPKRKVVIVTYMRSGSSLTGDIIQQHPDVFYVYEPLYSVEKLFYKRGLNISVEYTSIDNVTLRLPQTQDQLATTYRAIISNFFNCRITDLDVVTLMQSFMKYSKTTRRYFWCLGMKRKHSRLQACINPLVARCHRAPLVLLKVIRTTILNIRPLFTSDPQVSIIHLVRDPRAVISSRISVGAILADSSTRTAASLCQRMLDDLLLTQSLSKVDANRIFLLRYEDIVESPLLTVSRLYMFLNLTMSLEIEKYILNITYGGFPDGCAICPNRKNASESANRWRTNLSLFNVLSIQEQCKQVFELLGYRHFNSQEDMTNMQLKAYLSTSALVSDINHLRKNYADPHL